MQCRSTPETVTTPAVRGYAALSNEKTERPLPERAKLFHQVKVRYCDLKKNTPQLVKIFALYTLWIANGKLMGIGA